MNEPYQKYRLICHIFCFGVFTLLAHLLRIIVVSLSLIFKQSALKMKYEYNFVAGFRKNSKLLLLPSQQQLFKIKSTSKNSSRYICYIKDCNVTVGLSVAYPKIRRQLFRIRSEVTQKNSTLPSETKLLFDDIEFRKE